MATFNAEGVIKTVERRLDRIEASVAALEKSVAVLIDSRGDSKEDAVKKLQLMVKEQTNVLLKIPTEQIKALDEAAKQSHDQVKHLVGVERSRAMEEVRKINDEVRSETQRIAEEAHRASVDLLAQIKRLEVQAETQAAKREQAHARELADMGRKLAESAKAQTEALKNTAVMEFRFTKLEGMVTAAMALAAGGRGR